MHRFEGSSIRGILFGLNPGKPVLYGYYSSTFTSYNSNRTDVDMFAYLLNHRNKFNGTMINAHVSAMFSQRPDRMCNVH